MKRITLCLGLILLFTSLLVNAEDVGYFLSSDDNHVQVIHEDTNTAFATIAVGGIFTPNAFGDGATFAVDDTNNILYVTNSFSSSISVIDTETNLLTANILLDPTLISSTLYRYYPLDMALSDDNSTLYVAARTDNSATVAGQLFSINTTTLAVTAVGDLNTLTGSATSLRGITFWDDGTNEHVFVTDVSDNQIHEFVGGSYSRTISNLNFSFPRDVVVQANSSSTNYLYISNFNSGTVSVYNLTTDAYQATINTGGGPFGLLSDGTNIWVTDALTTNGLSIIDPDTNTISSTVSSTLRMAYPGITTDGATVYGGNYFSTTTTVGEYDVSGGTETATFALTSGTMAAAFQAAPQLTVSDPGNLSDDFTGLAPGNVEMMEFRLLNGNEAEVNMTSVTITASGTGNEVTDVASVRLFQDVNTDGALDGGDLQLGNTETYGSDDGTITFTGFEQNFAKNAGANFLIVYTFSASADQSSTFVVTVTAASDIVAEADYFEPEAFDILGTFPHTGPTISYGADEPTLIIDEGTNNPSTSTVVNTATDVVMLQIELNGSGTDVLLTDITLTASGTGDDSTGIANVRLFLDVNDDGALDGGDTLIVSNAGPYGADDGTITFSGLTEVITDGTTENWLVIYDFNGAATPASAGDTFLVSVAADGDITATDSPGATLTATISGSPVNGETVTIGTGGAAALTITDTTAGATVNVNNLESNVLVLSFDLTADLVSDIEVTGVTLTASGTGDDSADIESVDLVRLNANGSRDVIGTSTSGYAADDGTITISAPGSNVIPIGSTVEWGVVYKFNGTGSLGDTYICELTTVTAQTTESTPTAVTPTGTPLTGATTSITTETQPVVITKKKETRKGCLMSSIDASMTLLILIGGLLLLAGSRRRTQAALFATVIAGLLVPATYADFIYVACKDSANVVVMDDQSPFTQEGSIPVEAQAYDTVYAAGLNRLFVSNEYSGTVTVIDTTTNQVVDTLSPVNSLSPRGLALSPDQSKLYIAYGGGGAVATPLPTLAIVNTSTGATVTTLSFSTSSNSDIALRDSDGAYAYVSDRSSNSIHVINTSTDALVQSYDLTTAGFSENDPLFIHAVEIASVDYLLVSFFNSSTGTSVGVLNIDASSGVPTALGALTNGLTGPMDFASNSDDSLVFQSWFSGGSVIVWDFTALPNLASVSVVATLADANTGGDTFDPAFTPGIPTMIDDQTLMIPYPFDTGATVKSEIYLLESADGTWNPGGTDTVTLTSISTASAGQQPIALEVIAGPSFTVGQTTQSNATIPKNSTDVEMLLLSGTAVNADIEFDSLTITGTTTGDLSTDISRVALYIDENNDNLVDSGDTQLGSDQVFSTVASGTVTFSGFSEIVAKSSQIRLIVAADFAGSATNGETFAFSVAGSGDISADANWTFDLTTTPVNGTFAIVGPTMTMTDLAQTLTLSLGSNHPADFTVSTSDVDQVLMQLNAAALGANIDVTAVNITFSGTMDDSVDISQIEIWNDVNDDGALDGGDAQLDTETTITNDGTVTLTFTSTVTVNDGTNENFIVVLDLAGTASVGETVTVEVTANSDVTSTASSTQGAPVIGATATVGGGGATTMTLANHILNPGDTTISNFVQNHRMLAFTLTADSAGSITVSGITIANTGTGAEQTDIELATILLDDDNDGSPSAGDTYLRTVTSSNIVNDNQSISFSGFTVTLDPGETKRFLVYYDFAGTGAVSTTFQASVDVFGITSDASFETGGPVTGGTMTIGSELAQTVIIKDEDEKAFYDCVLGSTERDWTGLMLLLGGILILGFRRRF
jgi:YVTN family beta-propeller protein